MSFHTNDIIDYYDNRRISSGLVLELDDRRIRVLTDQGKEATISRSRVLTACKDPEFPIGASRDEQVARLREIYGEREKIKKDIDLQELWEVVGPETGKIDVGDLSELFFANNNDVHHVASLLRAIFEDKLYFKIRPDGIEVPTPERVEQALIQREKERERERTIAASAAFLTRLKAGKDVTADAAPEGLIAMLEEAALSGKDWVTFKTVHEIFSQAGLPSHWDPFRVLVEIGEWSEDENLSLRTEKIPIEFSPTAEACALEASSKPPRASAEDLTHLHPVTIDAVSTRDVDDALSLSEESGARVLGIHIADAAHFVEHGSVLDNEIRERTTSIYLPEMTIPMLPAVLSEGAASLGADCVRPAVSVIVRFGADLTINDYRVTASIVKVNERLSYEQADERIRQNGSQEAALYEIARALRDARVALGAVIFRDPEVSVRVAEDGTIEITRRDRETPSQILVSEMMILANSLFAKFMKDKHVPGLFRSQPPPLEKIELGDQYDPVESYRSKRLLARGDMGTTAAAHATLGLDAYTTATSPLRRYVDLVVQRQIKAALDGEPPPYDTEALERILTDISFRMDRASVMERERRRYFLLKYLERKRNEEFEAVVLHKFPRFYLVQITELALNAAVNAGNRVSLSAHDRVIIRVDKINPRDDKLHLSVVRVL